MYFTYSGGPVFDLSTKVADQSTPGQEGAMPKDAAEFAQRGAILLTRGQLASALADLDRACAMAPSVAAYFAQRGRIHAKMRQLPQAVADYEQAVRLDPADHGARLDRARVRVALHLLSPALEDLQALDQALPAQSTLRRDIGQIYLAAAQPALAVPQLNLWLAAHGDDLATATALNSRCWARALIGSELELAAADCDAALRAQPNHAGFLDSRALVYLRQGKLSEAMNDYEAALKLKPKSAWSLYGRGLIEQRIGKDAMASADIAAAKQLHPSIEAEAKQYGIVVP